MTQPVGGLRARLIRDNLFNMVQASLQDLGWFDVGRDHTPITMRSTGVDPDTEIQLNTLVLADASSTSDYEEMGSLFSEHRWVYFWDFFGENAAVAMHLITDVRDILQGRMPSIGRNGPVLSVIDYSAATPTAIFSCELENIDIDRAHGMPKPWQRFWYACSLNVVDFYATDADV